MNRKTAVVTGGGSGIGRAVAQAFAQRGWAVAVLGRRRDRLEETQGVVASAGGVCRVQSADCADRDAVAQALAEVDRELGRIDVLVNNAAAAAMGGIEDLDLDRFEKMLQVNTAGVVYACRAAWPMLSRRGGTIINISSMAAADPFPGLTTYGATKAFVNALTVGLAKEGKEAGIGVFAVGPGAVETEMLRASFPDFPAEGCLAPEDVAEAVIRLAAPEMRYATGQTIYVRK